MGFAPCAAGGCRWTFYFLDTSQNLGKPGLEVCREEAAPGGLRTFLLVWKWDRITWLGWD